MKRENGRKKSNTDHIRLNMKHFFRKLGIRITNLFKPEEVEVTFKVTGKNVTYTYTKVKSEEHKEALHA